MSDDKTVSTEELAGAVRAAMHRAFNFGQIYWRQADSPHTSQHKKSEETQAKFLQLVEETCALVSVTNSVKESIMIPACGDPDCNACDLIPAQVKERQVPRTTPEMWEELRRIAEEYDEGGARLAAWKEKYGDGRQAPATTEQAPPLPAELLADDHKGMRVDYSGLFKQSCGALARGHKEPALSEMLRQLQDHMTELGRRWYAGDTAVVDEILQLYCIEKDARAAIKANGVEQAPAITEQAPELPEMTLFGASRYGPLFKGYTAEQLRERDAMWMAKIAAIRSEQAPAREVPSEQPWSNESGASAEISLSAIAQRAARASTKPETQAQVELSEIAIIAKDGLTLLQEERRALTSKITELDWSLAEELAARDRAQDALLEASEAMNGPEWCAKIPTEDAPNSGDLHEDVPELCRQIMAENAELRAALSAPPVAPNRMTAEMFKAGFKRYKEGCESWDDVEAIIEAALSAAPAAPDKEQP